MWLLAVLVVLFGKAESSVHYVRPDNSSPLSCPGQPCHTIDQYSQQPSLWFSTGSSFVFLAGNHSLRNSIHLANVHNVTLSGEGIGSSSFILFSFKVAILCDNVTNLRVDRLVLGLETVNASGSYLRTLQLSNSEVSISDSWFSGTSMSSAYCNVTVANTLFTGSTADEGGAIRASSTQLTLIGCTFIGSAAHSDGGAIFAEDSSLRVQGMCQLDGVACNSSSTRAASENHPFAMSLLGVAYFAGNRARGGGAVSLSNSRAMFSGTVGFAGNSARQGGGIHAGEGSELVLSGEYILFMNNSAKSSGGAFNVNRGRFSSLSNEVQLVNNKAYYGGAVFLQSSLANFGGRIVTFEGNTAGESGGGIVVSGPPETIVSFNAEMLLFANNSAKSGGGAIAVKQGGYVLLNASIFSRNRAVEGGAVYLDGTSSLCFNGTGIEFINNSAQMGGAIKLDRPELVATTKPLTFIANSAEGEGGAVYIQSVYSSRFSGGSVSLSGNFTDNLASCGGAIFVKSSENVALSDVTMTGNRETALCVRESRVSFSGNVSIAKNVGRFGGGIHSRTSSLNFMGFNQLNGNEARAGGSGGGIYSFHGNLTFTGVTSFTHNTAETDGGAIYALGTVVTLSDQVAFVHNTATNGGAMYYRSAASLIIAPDMSLRAEHNFASDYGGVVYHTDVPIPSQCDYADENVFYIYSEAERSKELPYCFIQFVSKGTFYNYFEIIHSFNNSAGKDGSFLYGGLLDKCIIREASRTRWSILPYVWLSNEIQSEASNTTKLISSKPYRTCICNSAEEYDCSLVHQVEIHRGQRFSVPLVAIAQGNTTVQTTVTARTSRTARLRLNQSSQLLPEHCSSLSYNLYSTEESEEVILYTDSPCQDTGLSKAVINVTLLPCPDGFTKFKEKCICEERLRKYSINCSIDEGITLMRGADSQFWVSGLYAGDVYRGLVLCGTCPTEYCKIEPVNISLGNPDGQCANNRGGILCGGCAANYSLMLGSSRCSRCTNTFLALLLPFAAAGVALVAFLSILRLTVATGTVHSVILYANIVQVNRNLFYSTSDSNVLTIFIAWMNLDLGFETCFYGNMTAYAQTWLQFVFPVYVWVLIGSIILISRYSITVSRLIGHNPIAVLATLLLMSYTKILKIIIEVYSPVEISYPHNVTKVWLKDANMPYLHSWHLFLTVVTSLVLLFLFLPYTLLLTAGYKLYRHSGRRYFRWFNKMKPLLDSYYAPYCTHARFWPGFLLLVRCALYIVFSFNSLGATNQSLLAIVIAFTLILMVGWIRLKVYKSRLDNTVEAGVYTNLIILSAATSCGSRSAGLVFSLVGLVFLTMSGIVMHQCHKLCITKCALWGRVTGKMHSLFKTSHLPADTTVDVGEAPPAGISSQDPHKIVTKTFVELREPLLETQVTNQ